MKSIVVMTYYHLMHSIALALTFDEKPNLYVSLNYLVIKDEVLERIEETGIFNSVTGISRRGELKAFWDELRKTRDASDEEIDKLGDSLFEEYLEPYYKEAFKNADFEDEIYIYNDFPWHFYYIQKHFDKIVGVEDGYASLIQQISIHVHKGAAELVYPFIKKGYYPESVYKNSKFKKIISSSDFKGENLEDYYRERLYVWDFNDIVNLNREKFRDALLHIFELKDFVIKPNSCILLGQPLDRAKYCDSAQNYLLTRKMINNELEKGYNVYFKPHPADKNENEIHSREGVEIMSRDFPIEVFNYQDQKFEKLSTFSSTGASTIDFAKEYYKYFDKTDTSREEVTRFIKKEIKGEKITFNYYVKVKDKSPENYVNLYSCIFRNSYIQTNIYAIVDEKDYDEYREYYSLDRYKERIKEYREQAPKKESNAIHKELKWMNKWASEYSTNVEFVKTDSWEEEDLFKIIASNDKRYEYAMLIESNNRMFNFTKELYQSLRARVSLGFAFPQYTEVVDKKNVIERVSLKPGYVFNSLDGRLLNKVLHRLIIKKLEAVAFEEAEIAEVLNTHTKRIKRRYGTLLYVDPQYYKNIADGETEYANRIKAILANRDNKENEELAGQIANVVYDYYDWRIVAKNVRKIEEAFALLNDLIEDKTLLSDIYSRLTLGMFYEKQLSDRSELFQEVELMSAIRPTAEKAAETGVLTTVDNIERIKSKLKRK